MFDVILCDLMMPDTTGMDLHHELVRIAPDQVDRMVFMTGGAFTAKARSPSRRSDQKGLQVATFDRFRDETGAVIAGQNQSRYWVTEVYILLVSQTQ